MTHKPGESNAKLHCVAPAFFCDGYNDCQNGQDEQGCHFACKRGARPCNDGHCILAAYWCDGTQDCADGEDEVAGRCFGIAVDPRDLAACPRRDGAPPASSSGSSPGSSRKERRRSSLWCDGRADCKYGKDERSCFKPGICKSSATACMTAGKLRCVHESARCDGYADCLDGSDEEGCPEVVPIIGLHTSTRAPSSLPTSTAALSTVSSGPPESGTAGGSGATVPAQPPSRPTTASPSTSTPVSQDTTHAIPPTTRPEGRLEEREAHPAWVWIIVAVLVKVVLGLTCFCMRQWLTSRWARSEKLGMETATSFVFVGSTAEQSANGDARSLPQDDSRVDLLVPQRAVPGRPAPAPPGPPLLQRPLSASESMYETLRTAGPPAVDLLLSTLQEAVEHVYATPQT